MSPEEIARLLGPANGGALSAELAPALSVYLGLLLKWNARTNLTAVRTEREIVLRHFGESLFCARTLPHDAGTLLDFGSGAGFPGAVCALARPGLAVCLAESQAKKAAFLRELARSFGGLFEVHTGRVEALPPARRFDVVTLRAVDRMEQACRAALSRVRPGGSLALLTTEASFADLQRTLAGVQWRKPVAIPDSVQRVVVVGSPTAA